MRMVGYVNGIEVSFDFIPPNTFKAEIQKKISGQYIIQLKAIDSAGNETNYSDLFVRIDFQKMEVKILDENFRFNKNGVNFGFSILSKDTNTKEIECIYTNEKIVSKYNYRELVM
ncbi:Ig-like domain-containing protein [Clostridium sp. DL1XJH146]